jgi:protein-tyrosine-phosphatase
LTPTGGPRRILFVCTANRCRSPAAERLAAGRYGRDRARFRSAGFLDGGQACPARMVEALAEQGVDARSHRSRRLDATTLATAELILTMEGQHVPRLVTVDRAAYARTFPLREAAAVVGREPGGWLGLEAFLELGNQDRSPVDYLSTGWDVVDPFGGRLRSYRRAVAEIDELISSVLSAVL